MKNLRTPNTIYTAILTYVLGSSTKKMKPAIINATTLFNVRITRFMVVIAYPNSFFRNVPTPTVSSIQSPPNIGSNKTQRMKLLRLGESRNVLMILWKT